MKNLFCTILILISVSSFAQCDKYYGRVNDATRDSLNREVLNQFRCSGIARPKHIKVLNVFIATYEGFTSKSSFLGCSFCDFMYIDRAPRSRRLMNINAITMICDEFGKEIAEFDGYQFNYASRQYLTMEMIRLGINDVYMFLNECGTFSTFFGVDKNNETYIIFENKCQTFKVRDCPDDIWDKVFINPNVPSFEISHPVMETPIDLGQ